MSRFSQAWDFITRPELPDRTHWEHTFDSISDFSALVILRRERKKEQINLPSDQPYGGDIAVCSTCNYQFNTTLDNQKTVCPTCGERLNIYWRKDAD